jgi:hypothetical protein
MTTLIAAIIALAQRIRDEFNALFDGTKAVEKSRRLDDGATGKTYANIANEITTAVADAITAIRGGASTAGDTLKKLEDQITAIVGGSYATQAFVLTEIGKVIDTAPAVLDTLKELADALGGDANFSATVLGQLAVKANITDVYSKTESDTLYYTKTEIGDINHNFVADFENGLLP